MQFDKRINDLPKSILEKILKIDNLKSQWTEGAKLHPQVLGRLKKSTLITSAGASTRIEGAKLTDGDVEKLMSGLSVHKFADRDRQEVRGYHELLNNIFDSWNNLQFSENSIKHFHNELLKYVDKDKRHRGEYKKIENSVKAINESTGEVVATVFETTTPYLTPKEMQELVDWAKETLQNKKHHPLLIIGGFLVEFLKIHPFQDGNGRLSRILTNFLLLKVGYSYMPYISHEKLVEDNKSDYYLALRRSQKSFSNPKENIKDWMNFFLKMILHQSEMAIDLLSKENIEKLLSIKQLLIWNYLQEVNEASPGEISKQTGVARPTVNQALDRLMSLKKVERFGLGRSTRYKLVK